MKSIFALGLFVLALSGCVSPGDAISPREVTRDFEFDSIRWNSGEVVYFAHHVFEDGGKVAVCGSWAESSGAVDALNFELVRSMAVDMAGRRLVHSVVFFRKVATPEDLFGSSASCVRTDVDWTPEMERTPQELKMTRRRFDA
ncbi:MAG: hypothetical protein AAGE13_04605 [Pseudomonadota bacterium]